MWRFLLGIGIGGDYPLSAVITSEYTPRHLRGAMMASVFAMQVGGRPFAWGGSGSGGGRATTHWPGP
jgi:MFS family permease